MPKFRKRPVIIEAEQRAAAGEVWDYLHNVFIPYESGDWIITGTEGETYACKNEVFQKLYEPVNESVFDGDRY